LLSSHCGVRRHVQAPDVPGQVAFTLGHYAHGVSEAAHRWSASQNMHLWLIVFLR
jgi:hypothetical protein